MALRRRLIADRDLDAVAALLANGFPKRRRADWRRGLDSLRTRGVPDGKPRYGFALEADGRIVGVILTIFADVPAGGRRVTRANMSSWYVEDGFRSFAPLLINAALKERSVTYLNISPAPHTEATIEAQGFRAMGQGSRLYAPALRLTGERVRVSRLDDGTARFMPEAQLLTDHLAFGCLCLVVEGGDGRLPLVFSAPRRLRGLLPTAHLLYCRDLADFSRFAGSIGRALATCGVLAVLVDGGDPIAGLLGRRINARQHKYVFGPNPPRPGDLAYTELAFFHG